MGKTATVDNGESLSAFVDFKSGRAADVTPPALTANTARLGFVGSPDGGTTKKDIVDENDTRFLVTVGTTNDGTHSLPADIFKSHRLVAVECLQEDGVTPQAQGAARVFDMGTEQITS